MYNTDVQFYMSLIQIIARLDNIRTIYHVYNAQPFGETYSAYDRKTQIVQKVQHTPHITCLITLTSVTIHIQSPFSLKYRRL